MSNELIHGTITKGVGGLYHVSADFGDVLCRAGGRLRQTDLSPTIGDHVLFEHNGCEGYIIQILQRKNCLIRPSIANITRLFIVASDAPPRTDPYLIDKVIVIALKQNIEPVVVLNKSDLDRSDDLFKAYTAAGVMTLRVSAVTGEGTDELKAMMANNISAVTGNSGIGKSSLLNHIDPLIAMSVGDISLRISRGKHTTRHVELFKLPNGGFIADTPGFSSFEITKMEKIKKDDLMYLFPEFGEYIGSCRFADCAHIKEPNCSIRAAVKEGKIAESRYSSYTKLYEELSLLNDWED